MTVTKREISTGNIGLIEFIQNFANGKFLYHRFSITPLGAREYTQPPGQPLQFLSDRQHTILGYHAIA